MNSPRLQIEQSHSGPTCVVSVKGRIDGSNAGDFRKMLEALFAGGETSILLDLGAVLYMTSAAFRVLLIATDEAERKSVGFALCNVVGDVRDLFQIVGLLECFTVYGSSEEALAQMS